MFIVLTLANRLHHKTARWSSASVNELGTDIEDVDDIRYEV